MKNPIEPTSEKDEREDGRVSPDEQAMNEDSEDSNYLPLSEDEVILSDEDFIVPEEPVDQERFKRRLIATARSLKKKQQQLQADQDLLNDRWTGVLAAEEYGLERPTKSYLKHKLLPQFNDEALELILSAHNAADRPQHGRDKAATQDEHQPILPHCKGRDKTARAYTYDLQQDLDSRARHTRSINGSRWCAPTCYDGNLFGRDKPNHTRAECRRRTPSELHHNMV